MKTVEQDLTEENAAMCKHDAKVDEWERRFEILTNDLVAASWNTFYCKPDTKAIDIIERAAADLTDYYLEMET